MAAPFVPDDFAVPDRLTGDGFTLEPLSAAHNERDYDAWTSSMDHIHATPGFDDWPWPHPMPLTQNLADLVAHEEDFAARRGFTYTVVDPDDDVVGCVYIYPVDRTDPAASGTARVRSWVRVSRAELDVPLWQAVSSWLDTTWPFTGIEYAAR